jgi:hypothetical protein
VVPLLALPIALADGSRPASARRASVPPVVGVNIQSIGAYPSLKAVDQTISEARALHVNVVRLDLPWSVLEPEGPEPDARVLAVTDRLVADASAAGIRVLALADSTPCWASSAPASLLHGCVPGRISAANAWPPQNASDYGAYTALLARRYGTKLAAIEVWNEPDQSNEHYLAGPHKAERYAQILRAAYPAIKAAAPDLPVLAGSLVGSNGAFLKALYAAGIKGYYDGLAVHFYTLTLAAVRSIRETQTAAGDSTPLWLDEFGWSSCWPRYRIEQEQGCVTPQVQAANLRNTIRALAQASYVAAAVPYTLRDSPGEEFGVLTANGKRKPSFAALAGAFAAGAGRVSPITASLRRLRGHAQISGSGPVGDYMGLEVFVHGALRYRAVFTLNRFNRYSLTLPAVLGTSSLTAHVFQYWTGASHFAQASL